MSNTIRLPNHDKVLRIANRLMVMLHRDSSRFFIGNQDTLFYVNAAYDTVRLLEHRISISSDIIKQTQKQKSDVQCLIKLVSTVQ